MSLNRKEKILKLIVDQFIKTAEPVGSNVLIQQFDLPYSSATIRNDMAELEEAGYLEKTHTSSGRVPSAKGYRYYVENLRNKSLDGDVKLQLQTLFRERKGGIDDVVKHGCEIISQMTNLTSIMLGPNASKEKMSRIQLIPLQLNSVVAVFVTDRGHVESKTFLIPPTVSIQEIETCVNIINDRIIGTSINEVLDKIDALKPILESKITEHEFIFNTFLEAFVRFTSERMAVFGRENMLGQPEFTNNIDKLRKLTKLLDNDSTWRLLSDNGGISVKIGEENSIVDFQDVTVVTANFETKFHELGTIALIGPTRMDYDKVLNALEYLKSKIDEFFDEEE